MNGVGPKSVGYYAARFTIGPPPAGILKTPPVVVPKTSPTAGASPAVSSDGVNPVLIIPDVRRFQPRTILSKPKREQYKLDDRYSSVEGLELVYAVASKLSLGELWADSGCLQGVAGSKAHHEL